MERRKRIAPIDPTEALFGGPGLPSEAKFVDPIPEGAVLDPSEPVSEAVRDEDDHFYGAWWGRGGGRGVPRSRSQVISAPAYERPKFGAFIGAPPKPRNTKYEDLEEGMAWLRSKGVNVETGPPMKIQIPPGYNYTTLLTGRDGEIEVPYLYDLRNGDIVEKGTSFAYKLVDGKPVDYVAPFRGTFRRLPDGSMELVPTVANQYKQLGPYFGLDRLSPELRGRLLRRLEWLDSKYPGVMGGDKFRTLTVQNPGLLDMKNEYAHMSWGRMSFNARWFTGMNAVGDTPMSEISDQKIVRNYAMGWGAGDTFETNVVDHEFGHAVESHMKFDKTSPYSMYGSNPVPPAPDFRAMTQEQIGWYGEGGMTLDMQFNHFTEKRGWAGTKYGGKNHNERFAEGFARLQWMKDDTLAAKPRRPLTPWEKELRLWLNTIPGWRT